MTDLLNVESCHGDDVIDVRASANLLHVGEIPFRKHKTGRSLVY